jgi:hypothetical protein
MDYLHVAVLLEGHIDGTNEGKIPCSRFHSCRGKALCRQMESS